MIEFLDHDINKTRLIQRDQFETLYCRISDETDGFELHRLLPDPDPCPVVLGLLSRFEINEDRGMIIQREGPTTSQLLDVGRS